MDNQADLTLYFHPGSYYSRRVFWALTEKNMTFHRKIINAMSGEQNEDWYMRINPLGQVPVIQHGDRIVCNSDDIIKYIDSNFKTGNVLIPPEDTKLGQDVKELCQLINTIVIDVITYGLVTNQELSHKGLKMPSIMVKAAQKKMKVDVVKLGHMAEQKTDLSDAYSAKRKKWLSFIENVTNKKTVVGHLDNLEVIFQRVENILEKSRADASGQSSDVWLFGSQFTMADIYLGILLDRLELLGLESRYLSASKNPNTFRYYEQIRCRQSFKKLLELKHEMIWNFVVSKVKEVFPVLGLLAAMSLAVGLVIAWKKK